MLFEYPNLQVCMLILAWGKLELCHTCENCQDNAKFTYRPERIAADFGPHHLCLLRRLIDILGAELLTQILKLHGGSCKGPTVLGSDLSAIVNREIYRAEGSTP
jgi:hypothetical protein